MREGMLQSGARQAAGAALTSIAVGDVEAWKAASRRLVLVYQAYTADPVRPHISEAAYVWRYLKEEQLSDPWSAWSSYYYLVRSTRLVFRGWCTSVSDVWRSRFARCWWIMRTRRAPR